VPVHLAQIGSKSAERAVAGRRRLAMRAAARVASDGERWRKTASRGGSWRIAASREG
jgi:hypothetical protein